MKKIDKKELSCIFGGLEPSVDAKVATIVDIGCTKGVWDESDMELPVLLPLGAVNHSPRLIVKTGFVLVCSQPSV